MTATSGSRYGLFMSTVIITIFAELFTDKFLIPSYLQFPNNLCNFYIWHVIVS